MDWGEFNKNTIIKTHGDMYLYRDLYKGRHAEHSRRATELIKKGEVINYLERGHTEAINVRTPYLVINICKIICNVPALLISRSIGDIKTNHKNEQATNTETTNPQEMVEGTRDDSLNDNDEDLQQKTINQIVKNSRLTRSHKSNIIQHQIDGGIVGMPIVKGDHISIDFLERNVYYPHEDGNGVDLVFEKDKKDENDNDYVHVYTEREEDNKLYTQHRLYSRNKLGKLTEVTDTKIIFDVIGMKPEELNNTFNGRRRRFVDYWGNNVTFMDPYGVSELEGMEGKQEEVNWTVTRAAQTFERNGKPRISITPEVMDRLREIAENRYGDDSKIDHRDLEVTEMDEQGNSIQTHQIDIDKIGDMAYAKEIIKAMLAETNTSEKATDFLNDNRGMAEAASGVAKFYDLFISLIKAETLQNEYIEFIQNLFESALWLANKKDDNIIIEKPIINTTTMIPTPKDETDTININKYNAQVQSLETTVRELHPDKSDDWVQREVDRIMTDKSSDDSFSMANGRQSLANVFGNRTPQGERLNADGTVRDEDDEPQDE